MTVGRTANAVTFNTGISTAEYNDEPVGQARGQTQKSLLPGSTTVSEALDGVFPKEPSVMATVLGEMAAAGSSPALRTARGFRLAAERTVEALRKRTGPAAQAAADELERLLADGDLLESYRASILES